jgi:hypothetical protein
MEEGANNRVRAVPLQLDPVRKHGPVESNNLPDFDAGNLLPSRPALDRIFG